VKSSLPYHENKRQWSVNNCWSCILGNLGCDRLPTVIQESLAAIIGKTDCDTLPAPSWKWASMEHQQCLVVYLGYYGVRQVANSHNGIIGCLYRQKRKRHAPCPILIMCINGVSTIVGLPSWLITVRCGCYGLYTLFWLLLYATRLKNT